MKDNENGKTQTTHKGLSIGKRAARRRMQLDELERRQSEALARMNQERAALKQAVAEAEARARRQERTQQRKDEGQLKSILGALVLTVMRDGGPDALRMTSQDLLRLDVKDRQLLDQVWAVIIARAAAEQTPRKRKGASASNDPPSE
jgi:hypothetical protein